VLWQLAVVAAVLPVVVLEESPTSMKPMAETVVFRPRSLKVRKRRAVPEVVPMDLPDAMGLQ
jgi:hypothetical protein